MPLGLHGRFMWLPLLAAAALGCSTDPGNSRTIDASRQDVHAAINANAEVALRLAKALAGPSGNLIYSLISIEAVLGMLYDGADTETAKQLGAMLGAPADPALFHAGMGALLQDFGAGHGNTVALANRLFVERGITFLPDFAKSMHDVYRAPAQQLDFTDAEAARLTIDEWVSAQTSGKIPELFKPGAIDPATAIAVVDALYFQADWAHAFPPAATHDAPFQRLDGSEVQVPMMQLTATDVRSIEFAGGMLVDLPYRNGNLAFLAVLPPPDMGLPEMEQALSPTDLVGLVEAATLQESTIALPRFSMRAQLDLVPMLKACGIVDLFDPARADLSRIDGDSNLYVNTFVHEAWISVDEQGTVAAAATGATLQRATLPQPIEFNRPFLFVIHDELTGAALFAGRVVDPTQN
jgi:serpin B